MDLELTQIHEYKVFKDTGKAQFHNGKAVTPDGFQKIRVHFVYAVKHDGRFKARLVADGHLSKEPVESIYSGVVSLKSLRMVVFLSQLNDLEIWVADVGNAYLEAYTDEKLCIIAGPEFKELQSHLLIMIKALYGTRSGGPRWHDRLFDIHASHTNQQLVDRGANGGLAGSDMRVIHKPHRKINIQGIDNHEDTGLVVVTAATLLNTSQGKVIGIFNVYAYLGKGSSIHSSGQLEWFKTNVDEKSIKVGGTQLITTLDGYSVPLFIKDGLAYATSLGRPTDQDMDTYPHVFFTSPDELDPSVLEHDPPHLDGMDPSQVPDQPFGDPMFDAYGNFNECIIANLNILLDAPPEVCGSYTEIASVFTAHLHQSSPQEPDWNALRQVFAWTPPSSIKDTFNVTTRHGTAPHTQDYIKKHFKSRNPVFNIPRRSEAVATDTIFSDTPAVDDGSTMAQFFCGHDTLVCDAYGIKSTKKFINTLSDNIRKRGAMDTLISDGGKYEISKQFTVLLRSLFIQDHQSEPNHQHQNKAENRFGLAKGYTNTVMNTSGCPACCWLLCLQYICVVLNHLAYPTLQGICPVQALEGTTPDISFLLHFSFYEPVYYRIDSSEPDLNFPTSSNEKKGYWVGFADNQGDRLILRILTEDTQKIIIHSGI